jgi:hypothetical protein
MSRKRAMAELKGQDLLDALGVEAAPARGAARSPREERVVAGFEDILRFHAEHGRAPLHGEDRDIFERLYAVRLDQLRGDAEWRALLAPLDTPGLLKGDPATDLTPASELEGERLLDALGVPAEDEISALRHVPSREEKRAAEEIGTRTKCEEFDRFNPLFEAVRCDLEAGIRQTRRFQTMAEIKQGEFFIVGGQIAYVAELGEEFVTEYERRDSRLRVIYDNGTEGDVLLRSLQRALHRDAAGRRITNPEAGPLFGDGAGDDDLESGTIYVLRSLSDHPLVAEHRELVHKLGVTGGKVEARIGNAASDPTYLLADVEVVATYRLFNINRTKLETLLHRVFAPARFDIAIVDRFGQPVRPQEWFLVPLQAVDEAVERIRDGTIIHYRYDPQSASMKKIV